MYSEPFARLARHPRMIEPVQDLFGEQLYMHQFKINGKMAFEGDVWQWHQDYGTWKNDDMMPTERAMNVAIFLDDVNEFNGPLMFIPGSHKKGVVRAAEGRPIRVGLIGAGKFGSMYLAQVPRTPGVHLVGIADLSPEAACRNLARVGWEPQRVQAASLDAALRDGNTHVGDDWQALVRHPAIDVVVECTGHPIAAVDHCLEAFAHGKHVVNVTVEADAFCGPLLARKAAEAGVVYSWPSATSRR
jgi:threonine dehydrogenase-like Zn-dependent dehydrogenase